VLCSVFCVYNAVLHDRTLCRYCNLLVRVLLDRLITRKNTKEMERGNGIPMGWVARVSA
jgi:ribosomal protein L16/L10AE